MYIALPTCNTKLNGKIICGRLITVLKDKSIFYINTWILLMLHYLEKGYLQI